MREHHDCANWSITPPFIAVVVNVSARPSTTIVTGRTFVTTRSSIQDFSDEALYPELHQIVNQKGVRVFLLCGVYAVSPTQSPHLLTLGW